MQNSSEGKRREESGGKPIIHVGKKDVAIRSLQLTSRAPYQVVLHQAFSTAFVPQAQRFALERQKVRTQSTRRGQSEQRSRQG